MYIYREEGGVDCLLCEFWIIYECINFINIKYISYIFEVKNNLVF